MEPVVIIGGKGLTEPVVAEVAAALKAHELIKVRAPGLERHERTSAFNELSVKTQSELVQEIASREVAPRIIPAADRKPRISCTIGEQMWQQRWGGMDFR